jgi:hypothetical protein
MSAETIVDICMLLCATVGFSYGVVTFLAKKTPLYAKMITGAVACTMLGRLSAVVRSLTGFGVERDFRLSLLSYVGVFLFLLTANAGIMDGLADDGSKGLAKYRLMALGAPACIALIDVATLLSGDGVTGKVSFLVVSAFAALASYFNLKHYLIPDAEFGVIDSVRRYNLCAVVYAILLMAELCSLAYGAGPATVVFGLLLAADTLFILPMLKRGITQWQI